MEGTPELACAEQADLHWNAGQPKQAARLCPDLVDEQRSAGRFRAEVGLDPHLRERATRIVAHDAKRARANPLEWLLFPFEQHAQADRAQLPARIVEIRGGRGLNTGSAPGQVAFGWRPLAGCALLDRRHASGMVKTIGVAHQRPQRLGR